MARLDEDDYDDDVRDTSPMIRQGKTRSGREMNGHRPSAETTARAQRQLKRQSLIDDSTPTNENGK